MGARDTRTAAGSWWRRWLRRVIARGVIELEHLGRLYAIPAAGVAASEAAPHGLPGHPERMATSVPPSAVERALWRDLGWAEAPRRARKA